MLKLICGPSGAGKTAELIRSIRQDIEHKTKCFLLVPEQQAYISEKDLPAMLPKNAGLYFEVVNFSGLADDVFRECGGVTQVSVSGGIRSLLMWDTLRTCAPLLKQYGKNVKGDSTLTSLMLQTVTELRTSGISTEMLENAAESDTLNPILRGKLSDIALIDAIYHSKLEQAFGEEPADKLQRMAQKLRTHAFFADCHIYIDSFTSFTAPEYEVLHEILKQAKALTVTLCEDTFGSTQPHFESIAATEKRLYKLAAQCNSPIEKQQLSAKASVKPAALRMIERDLWRFSLKKEERTHVSEEERTCVRLLKCANLYEEAEAAAIHVCELVQSGMHYGDIAVIVRDTEVYRGVLDAALERYGIPYFLSEKTDLSTKPIARLILSALRAADRNYRQSDVITLLKTGLCGVDAGDAAMFEEYCDTWHIAGKRFTDTVWSMNPDGLTTERSARADRILAAANHVRECLIPPLQRLEADLLASPRTEDKCRALYAYLCTIGLPTLLSERAKAELALGQRREAGESVRLYRAVTEMLTTLCRLLPNTEMTTAEFINALSLLLSNSELGSVPNVQDCVVIGSASTLRVENVKASLLLGLCEGEFPRAVTDEGLFTEGDRILLEPLDICFDSNEKMRSSEELLYVYRAMTKPTERLFLSTVAHQTDGSARTPSLAFSRVAFLLEASPFQFDAEQLRTVLRSDSLSEPIQPIHAPAITERTVLRLSQSKIQAFVLCPYRYYSTYTLKLREQKDATPSYADDGTFLHHVFEHFLRASLDESGALHIPAEEDMEPLADRIIADYISKVCPFPVEQMDSRLLHLFARLRKLALMMLKDILQEIRCSLFVPSRFEESIGMPEEHSLPPVTLTLKNGSEVHLSGKIDRVDVYDDGNALYLRVVDYKSGKHAFSLEDIRSGMDIQLVVYLFALLSADPRARAFGAQYLYANAEKGVTEIRRSGFYLNEESLRRAADSSENALYTKKLVPQSAEELQALHEAMKTTVCEIAERILAGEASKTPSEEACTFCPIRAHCDRAYRK